MNRLFENGEATSKCELLQLGNLRIVNVKILIFNENTKKTLDEIDQVLKNIISWAKGRKATEVWIPTDTVTPADYKLKKLGFKQGAITVSLPGNSPDGWVLKLG